MGRLFQPVVLTMPMYHHGGDNLRCHKPSLEEMLAHALFEPKRGSVVSPSGCHSGSHCSECRPLVIRQRVKKPWIQALDMNGFRPCDIKINIDGNSLVIHARQEVKQGENFDVNERKRVVTIPDGVKRNRITCHVNHRGHFVIKGTFESDKSEAVDKRPASTKMEEQVDTSAEQTCDQSGDKANVIEDDRHLEGNPIDESKPLGEYVVTEVADEDDEESGKKSVASLADFIVECFAGEGEKKTDNNRSRSPVPSEDFVVVADSNNDRDPVDDDTRKDDGELLHSNMESAEVAVIDGNKSFKVKLNLEDYPADNINVHCKDNTLVVDAKREWNDGDMLRSQSVHRMYQLPDNAVRTEARASVDADGMFSITVPITENESDETVDLTVVQE